MLSRQLALTSAGLLSMAAALVLLTSPASAQDKKIIKKGSGQFEEHYELLPPEEGEPDGGTDPGAGNLDPEGDTPPPAAKPVKRAPTGSPKGTFGTPALAPAPVAPPAANRAAEPIPEADPANDAAEDATAPMDEPAPARAAEPASKKPVPSGQSRPDAAAAKAQDSKPAPAAAEAPADTDFFLAAIDQGGAWTKHAKHGDVFAPEVGSDWRPYTAGRWIYDTTLGWTWISDEPHGWATYHYGRWSFEKGIGWFWVPGTEWAPSWVVWRQGADAIGWAPLPPAAQFTSKGLSLDAQVIESDAFERAWVFVAPRYFGQQVMRRFIRPIRWNADLVDRTVPMLGYQRKDGLLANRGIAVEDVSRLAGNPPQRMTVSISPEPRFKQPSFRSGDEVKIYRPDERQIADLARKAAKIKQGTAASGTAKPSTARTSTGGTAATRYPAPAKAERTESGGSVTESWVKPAAPAAPKPATDAATQKPIPAPAKAQQTFAPAPAVQRTETGGAVTETWGDNAAAQKSTSKPETSQSKEQAAPANPATEVKEPGATSPASNKTAAGRDQRSESYSVPSPAEAGETPATPAPGASGAETGTAKPRWDGSGASGGPAMVPGAAP
jgi:hypothetical protein